MNKLNFKGNDPGAVTLGNFINYYSFHSPSKRMKSFPTHLWRTSSRASFVCLDIGCNSGDLTEEIYECLSQNLKVDDTSSTSQLTDECFFLAMDIDPILIKRAQEKNKFPEKIVYECADIMDEKTDERLKQFLNEHSKRYFDVTFCFSVSMWIHLNHGDEGLRTFLINICEKSKMVVIEPQPWKCYKSAMKRLKRHQDSFPYFEELTWRETVETDIERFLNQSCNFSKVHETPESAWGRRIVFLKKNCIE